MAARIVRFKERWENHIGELRELYLGFYNDEKAFKDFLRRMKKSYTGRKPSLRKLDEKRQFEQCRYESSEILGMMIDTGKFGRDFDRVIEMHPDVEECGVNYLHLMPAADFTDHLAMEELDVLTEACHRRGILVCADLAVNHINEEQKWGFDYADPATFNELTADLMYLANKGADIIRLIGVSNMRAQNGGWDHPEVHTLMRMIHLACGIVCPGVKLLGDVRSETKYIAQYFGTPEHPECDMLCNSNAMCGIWHTLATRDVKLIRHEIELLEMLPDYARFQNYLMCHDGIHWDLDYGYLGWFGTTKGPHEDYLNNWFTGNWPGSPARGELYFDPETAGDTRLYGTVAALSGVKSALSEENEDALALGKAADLMLHAILFTLSGIPVLHGGDEIGILNGGLSELVKIRKRNDVFRPDAEMHAVYVGDDHILGISRAYGGKVLLGIFNFTPDFCKAVIDNAAWLDLTEPERQFEPGDGGKAEYWLEPYGFRWLLR